MPPGEHGPWDPSGYGLVPPVPAAVAAAGAMSAELPRSPATASAEIVRLIFTVFLPVG